MSILNALKKKFNAKGNNIEEAIKTMEVSGSGSGAFIVHSNFSEDTGVNEYPHTYSEN